jgi:uncharacterized damage-inducible protein DinB
MEPIKSFAHWQQIRAGLLTTIDQFSDAELSYQPFEGGWTAGDIMLHIADAEEGWHRFVLTRELDVWPDQYTLANYSSKLAIKQALEQVHNQMVDFLNTLQEADLSRTIIAPWGEEFQIAWVLWHVLEHEIHHRGELSLILGLLGREGLDV